MSNRIHPSDGGCWFCHTNPEEKKNDMLFSSEFDTNFHEECLINALNINPMHPEAKIMYTECIPLK